MCRAWLVVIALAACGDNRHAGGLVIDAPPIDAAAIDAPPDATAVTWCTPTRGANVSMRMIGTVAGLGAIIAVSPPGDERVFIVERSGKIFIFDHEQQQATPLIDLGYPKGHVKSGGSEFGLLGLAFDPGFATNGYFYVFYTTTSDDGDPVYIYKDVLSRLQVNPSDPSTADPATERPLLSIPDFASNHNAGMIEFGADGNLYVSTGDGGGGYDPHRVGQDPSALLGKILRLDVDHAPSGKPYGVPADNPFASGTGGAPEVFMMGLRNPWRWSFDRATGDIWIGDVGQSQDEEIDFVAAGHQAGANLGWSMYEGNTCFVNYPCDPTGKVFPIDDRSHTTTAWRAIIGGEVYRGQCYPDLVGQYFYTDWSAGGLSRATHDASGTFTITDLPGTFPANPSSLHEVAHRELYMTTTNGEVYHLEAAP